MQHVGAGAFLTHAGSEAFYASGQRGGHLCASLKRGHFFSHARSGGVLCTTPERRPSLHHAGAETFFYSHVGPEAFYVSRWSEGILCGSFGRRRHLLLVGGEAFDAKVFQVSCRSKSLLCVTLE